MKNIFIQKVYDENGILVKEVYNWYTIGTFSVLLILSGVCLYYVYFSKDGDDPDFTTSGSETIFSNPQEKISNDVLKIWNINTEMECFQHFNAFSSEIVEKLNYLAHNEPELFDALMEGPLTQSNISLINSVTITSSAIFLCIIIKKKTK